MRGDGRRGASNPARTRSACRAGFNAARRVVRTQRHRRRSPSRLARATHPRGGAGTMSGRWCASVRDGPRLAGRSASASRTLRPCVPTGQTRSRPRRLELSVLADGEPEQPSSSTLPQAKPTPVAPHHRGECRRAHAATVADASDSGSALPNNIGTARTRSPHPGQHAVGARGSRMSLEMDSGYAESNSQASITCPTPENDVTTSALGS
jgi:hypothetical protein